MPLSNSIGTPAILLAAGMSRRMGKHKMMLPFGDRPMVARVIDSLLASGIVSGITVVTGHAEQEITELAANYDDVVCVHNPCYAESGMLSSVKIGVLALPPTCVAFFLVLGDQPMVRPETLLALCFEWHSEDAPIVVPSHCGKRGHPVLISSSFVDDILALGESDTLKSLMLSHAKSIREVPVDDPATVHDIDTPEDYEAALRRWRCTGG